MQLMNTVPKRTGSADYYRHRQIRDISWRFIPRSGANASRGPETVFFSVQLYGQRAKVARWGSLMFMRLTEPTRRSRKKLLASTIKIRPCKWDAVSRYASDLTAVWPGIFSP